MTRRVQPSSWRYVACYALYAVLLVVCVVDFAVWQQATLVATALALGQSRAVSAVHGAAVVIGALILFGVAMAAEPYLRSGVRRGELRVRFGRVALGLAAFFVGLAVVLTVAYRAM